MSYIYTAEMRGSINGSDVLISGNGIFRQTIGLVEGTYNLAAIPVDVDPLLVNAVLVTGYPSVCQASGNATNPFEVGSYSYTREIDLGAFGHLSYSAECNATVSADGTKMLESQFRLEGDAKIPKLVSTEPLTECWIPAGLRRLHGNFAIRWLTAQGSYLSGVAATRYLLPECSETPAYAMKRLIQLRNTVRPGTLTVQQVSSLRLLEESKAGSIRRSEQTDDG